MSPERAPKLQAAESPKVETPEPEPLAIRVPLDIRSVALTILVVLAVIFFLQYAQAVIIPFVLGVLISYALDPIVTAMSRLHLPRAVSAGILLLALTAAGATMLYQLRFQADAIVQQLPDAARRLGQVLEQETDGSTGSAIKQMQKAATELEKAADAATTAPPAPKGVQRVQVEQAPIRVSDYVIWGSLGIAAALAQLVLVLLLAFFLLSSGDLYKRKLVKIVGPSLTKKKITLQILEEIDHQIARFLMVQIATSAIVGVATWLAFRWIGLEQAAVWGLLAGIFNSIPYFGPLVVTAGIAVVAFLQFGTLGMTLWTAAIALTITTLEGFLLTPWLTSRAAQMNAVAVFVGLLFWGWVWDIWGMLLAVPMLMVVKAVCDRVDDFKSVGELLGD